jgi:hypothetical protein
MMSADAVSSLAVAFEFVVESVWVDVVEGPGWAGWAAVLCRVSVLGSACAGIGAWAGVGPATWVRTVVRVALVIGIAWAAGGGDLGVVGVTRQLGEQHVADGAVAVQQRRLVGAASVRTTIGRRLRRRGRHSCGWGCRRWRGQPGRWREPVWAG